MWGGFYQSGIENFSNIEKKNKCICLITYKPNDIWLKFLNKFTHYDIYVIIDDNSIDYINNNYNINFIQIPNEECKRNGFINMNFIIQKEISGWDKAIYYFSMINTSYENVWFIEDDVFFDNENTILNIDSKYPKADLLSTKYTENATGHKNDWHWQYLDIKIPPPYYYSMVCAIRISKRLLSKIRMYADEYNTLFFLEALFPTLCKRNNLVYKMPVEMKHVVWRKDYTIEDIDRFHIYHPVKNMDDHLKFRAK